MPSGFATDLRSRTYEVWLTLPLKSWCCLSTLLLEFCNEDMAMWLKLFWLRPKQLLSECLKEVP